MKCNHEYAFIKKKRADWIPFRRCEAKYYRCILCNKEKIIYLDMPKGGDKNDKNIRLPR